MMQLQGETSWDSSLAKVRPFVKNTLLAVTGQFLHVIANVFFNGKDYLNDIWSKYPVSAKRDKFLTVTYIPLLFEIGKRQFDLDERPRGTL